MFKYMRPFLKISILGLVIFTIFSINTDKVAYAQLQMTEYIQKPISLDIFNVEMNPENPVPGSNISFTAKSFDIDINRSEVSWYVDKKLEYNGTGKISFSTVAPNIGQKKEVTVTVRSSDGKSGSKTIILQPADLSIAWEASGYVPPFYKGKAHYSHQSDIRFVALPDFYNGNSRIDPKNLIYKWKRDSKVLGQYSGFGKQYIDLTGNVSASTMEVNVEVSSLDGKIKAERTITIDSQNPEIVFYERDPLYGILYNKSTGSSFDLKNKEMVVTSIPYYFNTKKIENKDIVYDWGINNKNDETLNSPYITLRSNGDKEGTTMISLQIRNVKDILQGASENLRVSFRKDTSSNNDNIFNN